MHKEEGPRREAPQEAEPNLQQASGKFQGGTGHSARDHQEMAVHGLKCGWALVGDAEPEVTSACQGWRQGLTAVGCGEMSGEERN